MFYYLAVFFFIYFACVGFYLLFVIADMEFTGGHDPRINTNILILSLAISVILGLVSLMLHAHFLNNI